MNHVELIIFDLDGTLINSLKDISLSLNFALKKLGLKGLNEEEVRASKVVPTRIQLLVSHFA